MTLLTLFEVGDHVVAHTHMMPPGMDVITPGTKGVVTERTEIPRRQKVRFVGDRDMWVTSDQIRLDPDFQEKEHVSEDDASQN